jgi:hypothetical protein
VLGLGVLGRKLYDSMFNCHILLLVINILVELVLKIAHTNYKYKLSLDLVIANKYYKSLHDSCCARNKYVELFPVALAAC